jgi:hypothetical protein
MYTLYKSTVLSHPAGASTPLGFATLASNGKSSPSRELEHEEHLLATSRLDNLAPTQHPHNHPSILNTVKMTGGITVRDVDVGFP